MAALSEKQRALLLALRDIENDDSPMIDIPALAAKSGYSEASIRTYFTKKLEGVLVFRHGDGWRVEGATRCAERAFARHMTQKAGSAADSLQTEEAWQMAVRKLLYEGHRRSYNLGPEENAILDRIAGLAPAPRKPDQRPQQGLFKD